MRKLLLGLLLLVTFAVNAQAEFARHYEKVIYKDKNGREGSLLKASNTIIYNYNDSYGLRIIMKDNKMTMTRTSKVEVGYTSNNVKYQIATYEDIKDGLEIRLQIFDNPEYGVRIIFDEGETITLYH